MYHPSHLQLNQRLVQQNQRFNIFILQIAIQQTIYPAMSNQSSESLKVNYVTKNQRGYVDVQDIENLKSERKKAKHQQLDHLYSENYKPANYTKALAYKNTRSYKKKLPNGQYKEIQTLEDTETLKYFGLGPYFFIEYMRRIVWVFFVLSLFEAVRIYINIKSDGMAKYAPTFSTYLITTTLGNYNGKGILSDYDNYIMAIVPGITFFAFLVFYLLWKGHYNGEIDNEEEDNSVVKPEKFCIEVEGLDVEKVDERELERLFSVFGPVYEVSLVRRFKNKLSYFEELDQIEEQIKEQELELILGSGDQQNLTTLKRQKQKLSKFINTLRINPQIISAFIHFQYQKSKVDCLGYYNDHYMFDSGLHTCFKSVCCCCIDQVQEKYLYKGKPLSIKNAKVPTPQDINWQSYEIGICSKIFRVIIAILIILVFIFISTSIIALCSIYINTHASDCEGVDLTKECVNTGTVMCSNIEKVCYCNKNVFTALNDDKMNAYCKNQMNQFFISQGIQYAVVATSAITNTLFGIVVDKIINFTRPKSYSSGLMTKTIVYTLFLIFNTVFIPILIYSDIYGFKTTNYASLLTIISADLKNALRVNELTFYLDFERVWYSNVSPIFTNVLIMDTIFTWIFWVYNKIMGDKEGLKDDQGTILQKSMNEKITAFKYNLYIEFAYFNLIIFMGVFLSGGMPVMIPLAFLSLISRYITSRSIIQTLSSKIEGLGVEFMSYPFTFLPILIITGSLFSCWMLTANESLQPPNLLINIPIQLPQQAKFHQLIRQLYLPYFLIIALLTIVWFFFQNTIVRFFSWLSSLCFEKKEVVHPYHTRPFSDYAKNMNVLASFNIRNNDKMRNVILNLEKYLVVNEDKF